jgi:hypothetical protein
MSRRLRATLIIIGLLLVGISLAALMYALFPPAVLHDATPLAPTLFALPPGGAP